MSEETKEPSARKDTRATTVSAATPEIQCGVIMPISGSDAYSESHWLDVYAIICEALAPFPSEPFKVELVSNADDAGLILNRIVTNVYEKQIVICDVSSKNPNVMFELGMRLAFDKPVILIKDERTSFSFDTAGLEHLVYPADLRYQRIVDFKAKLRSKALAIASMSSAELAKTSFLKSFGKFIIQSPEHVDITPAEVSIRTLESVEALRMEVMRLRRETTQPARDQEVSFLVRRRIRQALLEESSARGVAASKLLEDSTFMAQLETSISAARHFPSREAFELAVHREAAFM